MKKYGEDIEERAQFFAKLSLIYYDLNILFSIFILPN